MRAECCQLHHPASFERFRPVVSIVSPFLPENDYVEYRYELSLKSSGAIVRRNNGQLDWSPVSIWRLETKKRLGSVVRHLLRS